jgi:hypothetical protein
MYPTYFDLSCIWRFGVDFIGAPNKVDCSTELLNSFYFYSLKQSSAEELMSKLEHIDCYMHVIVKLFLRYGHSLNFLWCVWKAGSFGT